MAILVIDVLYSATSIEYFSVFVFCRIEIYQCISDITLSYKRLCALFIRRIDQLALVLSESSKILECIWYWVGQGRVGWMQGLGEVKGRDGVGWGQSRGRDW